jgi:3,4-dihydroxy 2-butanone 4-phosphate synthase/GTP cyclohydrolase II
MEARARRPAAGTPQTDGQQPRQLDGGRAPLLQSEFGQIMQKVSSTPCPSIERVAEANLPTEFGLFRIIGFRDHSSGEEIVALAKGILDPVRPTLVRLHSQCLTGDVFHSVKCDCGRQIHQAMRMIEEEGSGVIVYQQQEGRGIGLMNKIRAYALQDQGQDTVEANISLGFDPDLREYRACVQVIKDLGVRRVRLLSNNPEKLAAIQEAGLEVVERVSLEIEAGESALNYLKTKKEKLGHLLDNVDL